MLSAQYLEANIQYSNCMCIILPLRPIACNMMGVSGGPQRRTTGAIFFMGKMYRDCSFAFALRTSVLSVCMSVHPCTW